jgi:hypothetical protein
VQLQPGHQVQLVRPQLLLARLPQVLHLPLWLQRGQ